MQAMGTVKNAYLQSRVTHVLAECPFVKSQVATTPLRDRVASSRRPAFVNGAGSWGRRTRCTRLVSICHNIFSVVTLHPFLFCDLPWEVDPLVCAPIETLDPSVFEFTLSSIQ